MYVFVYVKYRHIKTVTGIGLKDNLEAIVLKL